MRDTQKYTEIFSEIEPDSALKDKILTRIEEEKIMKKHIIMKPMRVALIAASVAVLGTITAFAAGNVITYFQSEKATPLTDIEELSKYNSEIGATDTKEGYTLTLDNVAADDNYVHVFYTITSEKPLFEGDSENIESNLPEGTWVFNLWSDCIINNKVASFNNHTTYDGYFTDEYTYKGQTKYNIAVMDIPDNFKLELLFTKTNSTVDLSRFDNDNAKPLTDEEKEQMLYVAADINKSDVKVNTVTKNIKKEFQFTDGDTGNTETGEITKLIFSPFGTQLVVKDTCEGFGASYLTGLALFDENGKSIDILNTDLCGVNKGLESVNSLELLKASPNTKSLTFVPVKVSERDENYTVKTISNKIGEYPITYKLSDYGSIVVTNIRITDGQIAIDYYKDGFSMYDPGFLILDDEGNDAEPGGKLDCVLYTETHNDTNSYTARYVYEKLDENGEILPPDESVSAEALKAKFTTLECFANDITLDYDNAFTVNLK